MPQNHPINIGILAHVDAGKTSITEQFLYKSGAIRTMGSVDKGTSQSDHLPVEKERGISVRSSSASFKWKNQKINLIDTPGHVDFSAEVERSLRALDCAILVLSAVEGVQAHASTIWNALRQLHIPTILFINKIDRMGSNAEGVIGEIRKELTPDIVVFQAVANEGTAVANIINTAKTESIVDLPEDFVEAILNNDDKLLENYLENDSLDLADFQKSLKRQSRSGELFPVLMGSAKFAVGLEELLDAVVEYLPRAQGDEKAPVSGIVYKVEHDNILGRLAHIRLFNGSLKNRDSLYNASQDKEEKISQIRKQLAQKFEDTGKVKAGDTAALGGLSSIRAGDIIGNSRGIHNAVSLNTPLLTVSIAPKNTANYSALVKALQVLTDEDPAIDLLWLKEERELHIKAMGLIQLEIMETILLNRFELEVIFGEPSVIYKETPTKSGEAYEEYTMPKPCWAVVRFQIEPGERGSGVSYHSLVGQDHIAKRYQQEIERTLPLALRQGILGWELTDLKITLTGGEHHNIHSRAGDFAIATPMALLKGLKDLGTTLLEPMLSFTISGPENTLGKVIGSLTQVRAQLDNPEINKDEFTLKGIIPVAASLDYATKLSAVTAGKGKLTTRFTGYRECSVELGNTATFRGISPLDRAKYILKARKALQ